MWSPVRKALGLADRGYLGEWHAFRQYVTRRRRPGRRATCSCGSTPTCCPGTPGRSRCPAGGPTSASACCRDGTAADPGHEGELWAGLLDRPHVRDGARAGGRARGPPHGVADPGPRRRGAARRRAGAARRRRRDGHRRDDRRGHRPGAADRPAGRRGDRRRPARWRPTTSPTATSGRVRHHLVADHRMSARARPRARPPPRRPGARSPSLDHAGAWGRRNFARWMFEDEPRAVVAHARRAGTAAS